jgi:hypothetical protein
VVLSPFGWRLGTMDLVHVWDSLSVDTAMWYP